MKKIAVFLLVVLLCAASGCAALSSISSLPDPPDKVKMQSDTQYYIYSVIDSAADITYFQVEEEKADTDNKTYTASCLASFGSASGNVTAHFTLTYKLADKEWELGSCIQQSDESAQPAQTPAEDAAPTPEPTATESAPAQVSGYVRPETLSDDLFSFEVQINDDIYAFPMSYQDFLDYGWTLSDDSGDVSANSYEFAYFSDGTNKVTAYIANLGINIAPYSQCLIAGISFDEYSWKSGSITLPGGVKYGESTLDNVLEVYGESANRYDGSIYTSLSYDLDSYRSVEVKVGIESKTVNDIRIMNAFTPDWYNIGECSGEEPSIIATYVKPTALTDDPLDYVINIDGDIYSVPFPVTELIANGWAINESDEYIVGNGYGYINLVRGASSMRASVYNYTEYAVLPQYCFIEEYGADSKYSSTNEVKTSSASIGGGISIGMSKDEFLSKIDGLSVDIYEASSYTQYTIMSEVDKTYDFCVCVDVDTETKTVTAISVLNSELKQ